MTIKYQRQLLVLFFWGVALFWMLLIFSFSNEPGQISSLRSQAILERIQPAVEQIEVKLQTELVFINRLHFYIRKYAHVLAYYVLAVLLQLALQTSGQRGPKSYYLSWLLATLFAMLDELHQTFIPGRTGAWVDVAIDSAGIILGLITVYFIRQGLKRKKVKYENKGKA